MQHDDTSDTDRARAAVGRAIDDLSEQVAESVAAQIHDQLTSYAGVPRENIIASVQRNISRGIAVLIDGAVPTSMPEQAEAGNTTRERLEQGARWEDIVRAYRMSLTAVHEAFLKQASKSNLEAEATLEGSFLLWELGDWFINGSAEAFTAWSNEVAGARATAEAEFVRGLLSNDWRNPKFSAMVRQFSLNARDAYRVFIAPEHAQPSSTPVIISAVLQHRLIGLVPADQSPELGATAVAVGTPCFLDQLADSVHIAETIWPAVQSATPGVYDLETIGWKVAIPQYPHLSRIYLDRYITPLQPDTSSGQALIASLKVLLQHDGNIRLAARELQLHENSLRYRLERFSEKTGIELTSLDHKIGLAWGIYAYEYQRIESDLGEFHKDSGRSSNSAP